MILCIGTTPALQRVMVFRKWIPGAVNRAAETLDGVAGKSISVAKVLKVAGENPLAVGFAGGDRGTQLRSGLNALGIEHNFVAVTAPTRQCITVIDDSTGTQTELVEESRAVSPTDCAALTALFERHILASRAVVMSGTLAPGVPVDFYFQCARRAGEAGILSVIDAQGIPLIEALKARPGLVKPNRGELAATVGRTLGDEAAVMAAMRELHERGAQRVVVTAGKDPTLAFDGKSFWKIATPHIAVLNPIGSGDSFTAGLVWRLARSENLGEACRWGAAAGAANAMTLMPGEVRFSDMERLAKETIIRRI